VASAGLALSLTELLRAGALLPDTLNAIAESRRARQDPLAPVFLRMAKAVQADGWSLFQAVQREQAEFSPRFVALLAVANLGGPVFRAFVGRFREFVERFNDQPVGEGTDFPILDDEVREFCFHFGHLTMEKASQPAVQQWLPKVFTHRMRLAVTHVLSRFYDQGLLLSEAFRRTPPFDDPEMVLAVEAGEQINRTGAELIELADWLRQRRLLEERLRTADLILPATPPFKGPDSPPAAPPSPAKEG
jgi:type II secretory pathway component PulF